MMNNTRYEFGVAIDLLHDMPAKKIRNRVTDVRDQKVSNGFEDLNATAQMMYNNALQLFMQGRYRFEPKYSTERYSLLRKAKGLLVLTYRYDKVKWEVSKALEAGTPVAVFSPYKTPDMVKPRSVAEWETICDREANPDWAVWMDELDINLTAVLNTETPWLGTSTLKELANQFPNFDLFLEYLQAETHDIEAKGEWDVDVSNSVVYNEKASVAHYVANKGMDKGRRTCSSSYKYGKKEFWYNYEVLPVDTMTKFLHLSYLDSIDYKPLQRIVSDGTEYGIRKYFEFLSEEDMDNGAYEQGLTVTPLYEDPYFTHEGEVVEEQIPVFDSGRSCSTCDSDEPCSSCPNYR